MLIPIGLDDMRVKRWPVLCIALAAITIVAFVPTWLLPPLDENHPFFSWGLTPDDGLAQVGWLSHMFLHAGLGHLIGNLLFLYIAAPYVEDRWGRAPFLLLYLAGGALAGAAQVLLDPSSTVPIVGASGAVAVCIGAFSVQFPSRRVRMAYWFMIRYYGTFSVPAWLWGGLWFAREVLSLVVVGPGSGIAFGAHVGGFLVGATVAAIVVTRERRTAAPPAEVARAAPVSRVTAPRRAVTAPVPAPAPVPAVTLQELEQRASADPGGPRYLR
jgi:membrane associated rhomboid family serine protease